MADIHVQPASNIQGMISLPGDKSISHRALIFASIAEGRTQISGLNDGLDVLHTINALKALGVNIIGNAPDLIEISGVGLHGLKHTSTVVSCGNSGTSMRLLSGLVAGCEFTTQFTGDASLSRRPMLRVIEPLTQMGAHITSVDGHAPLAITGKRPLRAIQYALPVASSQVKSALLLAALYADGLSVISEPVATRDHTERLLRYFGYPITTQNDHVSIAGGHTLYGRDLSIPADISAAAFFIVAATLCPNAVLEIPRVSINPGRMGLIQLLIRMQANITLVNVAQYGDEPVADLIVKSAQLKGITVENHFIASTIDELPILMIAASKAEGNTRIQGAAELRVKESDRIAAMVQGLRNIGVTVEEFNDGVLIQGGRIRGGCVDAFGDHRIAMAFCIAGFLSEQGVTITNGDDSIATSFPSFFTVARSLDLGITH